MASTRKVLLTGCLYFRIEPLEGAAVRGISDRLERD
jgi:hypothetical protein